LLGCVGAAVATSATPIAQNAPVTPSKATFEVASIRRGNPDETNSGFAIRPGGRFVAMNVTARQLLAAALHLEPGRIIGGPAWVDTDRFNVEAVAFENATRELLEPLIRSLLAERFRFQGRTEEREVDVFLLKRASPQTALRPSALDCSPAGARARAQAGGQPATGPVCSISNSFTRIAGGGVSLAALSEVLSRHVGRPVVDQTALSGLYDFEIQFAPDPAATAGAVAPGGDRPLLVTALREQLGLHLESGTAALTVVVIEAIEQPKEN
jgi:uncharacterized protein (TIGR03435 family)